MGVGVAVGVPDGVPAGVLTCVGVGVGGLGIGGGLGTFTTERCGVAVGRGVAVAVGSGVNVGASVAVNVGGGGNSVARGRGAGCMLISVSVPVTTSRHKAQPPAITRCPDDALFHRRRRLHHRSPTRSEIPCPLRRLRIASIPTSSPPQFAAAPSGRNDAESFPALCTTPCIVPGNTPSQHSGTYGLQREGGSPCSSDVY